MVKFLTDGRVKIVKGKYMIEIDEKLLTTIYRTTQVGQPMKVIYSFQTESCVIDCIFKASDIVYEHQQRSNPIM
jgi:hypothetical protein